MNRPLGLLEVEASRFLGFQHMNMVKVGLLSPVLK
jgi:hypothetical protein